jgi:hypothetical protein
LSLSHFQRFQFDYGAKFVPLRVRLSIELAVCGEIDEIRVEIFEFLNSGLDARFFGLLVTGLESYGVDSSGENGGDERTEVTPGMFCESDFATEELVG